MNNSTSYSNYFISAYYQGAWYQVPKSWRENLLIAGIGVKDGVDNDSETHGLLSVTLTALSKAEAAIPIN